MNQTTAIIEGYCCVNKLFGVSIHQTLKSWVSISDDLLAIQMKPFQDKKIRITIEVSNEPNNNR